MKFQTYGCSFTEYYWPTWTNFLQSQHTVQRYGSPGIGNTRIAQNVLDNADEDHVQLIMWSGFDRLDVDDERYLKTHMGSGKYVGEQISLQQLMSNTIEAIHRTNQHCAKHDITVYNFLAFPLQLGEHSHVVSTKHDLKKHLPSFAEPLSMFCLDNPKFYPNPRDHHPCPSQHLAYVNTVMAPQIGIKAIAVDDKLLEEWDRRASQMPKPKKWQPFQKQIFKF